MESAVVLDLQLAPQVETRATAGTAGVAGTGAWKLWSARRGDADAFNRAKGTAILGCGLAMLVWFGGFSVIATALQWGLEESACSPQT